jgi:hypothetical protein
MAILPPQGENGTPAEVQTSGSNSPVSSSEVITIEAGKHARQWVDTSGGEIRVVGPGSPTAGVGNRIGGGRPPSARLRLKQRVQLPGDVSSASAPNGLVYPGGAQLSSPVQLQEDEKPFDAGDFLFVPVGNGLYRKEYKYGSPAVHASSSSAVSQNGTPREGRSGHGCCGQKVEESRVRQNGNFGVRPPQAEAPLIIAPMNMDGCSLADVGIALPPNHGFDELGYLGSRVATLEQHQEATHGQQQVMSPSAGSPSSSNGFYDIYYAASCVIPGECQCGDSCTCEGCPTHDPLHAKSYDGVVQDDQVW